MRDHTQLDWRPLLPTLRGLPVLNCVGGQSGVFPVEGCLEIGRLAPECKSVVFKQAAAPLATRRRRACAEAGAASRPCAPRAAASCPAPQFPRPAKACPISAG